MSLTLGDSIGQETGALPLEHSVVRGISRSSQTSWSSSAESTGVCGSDLEFLSDPLLENFNEIIILLTDPISMVVSAPARWYMGVATPI